MKKEDHLTNTQMNESAKTLIAQKHLLEKSNGIVNQVKVDLDNLSSLNDMHSDALDLLLSQAELLLDDANASQNTDLKQTRTVELLEFQKLQEKQYDRMDTIDVLENESWLQFSAKIDDYLYSNRISLHQDPFEQLLSERERVEITKQVREDYKMTSPNCDRYDYMIAAFCGTAAGLIDSFFVGMPGKSKLGSWTDQQVDNLVVKFAQTVWNSDKRLGGNLKKEPDGIASAIGFLERRFKVNYDARYASDLYVDDQMINMRPSDHHLKSLGHSPDIIGLFFSILDQFTGKASFIADGKIIRLVPIEATNRFELQGSHVLSKLFAGFANWLGHLISDISGSSGTRGHNDGRRGAGIPIPFYSLFQLCDFGSIKVGDDGKSIAEFSTAVFESGYDARFGATMAIPVIFNELAIRLLWAIKSKYYHKRSWKESLPVGNKPELRRMLVVGHGALCLVDGIDAKLRSTGNPILFATRLNVVAWSRFTFSALIEVRGIYKEQGLDLNALDKDLDQEWSRLFATT